MSKLSHNIISLAATGALVCMAVSCLQEELVPEDVRAPYEFEYIGNPTDAVLELSVEGLSASVMTRGDGEVDDSEAERRVTDIWVFQYNADGSKLISDPQYMTIAADNQEILRNIPITLSDNNSEPCIVYVITNIGDSNWVTYDDDTKNYTGFDTLDNLKKQTIPDASPIRVDTTEEEDSMAIPMSGDKGEDENDELVIEDGTVVRVPVKRMYAKVVLKLVLVNDGSVYNASLKDFTIDRIVNYCTVETCYNDDGSWYYPDLASFEVSRTITSTADKTDTSVDGQTTYGTYTMYIPENLQDSSTKNQAIKVVPTMNVELLDGTVIAPNPSFSAYPGSWSDKVYDTEDPELDYQIQRNCVYYIQFTITLSDLVVPTANCIIATAGTTIAFFPYVRDEELTSEMSSNSTLKTRYTYSTYLDYDDDTQEKSKTIASVDIIWQTQDCIGNIENDPTLVTIDSVGGEDGVADERHRKIYVKVANYGNALIGAYNQGGDIIWSWHIWVPYDDPEADAIEYQHYQWNNSKIFSHKEGESYVPGRLVMNLNLGALATKPDTKGTLDTDTFGMLYQWGRKDPFPPTKVTADTPGMKTGQALFNYGDSRVEKTYERTYDVLIGVYDRTDTSVPMTDNDGSISSTGYLFDTDAPSNVPGGSLSSTDDDAVILASIRRPTTFIAASDKYANTDSMNIRHIYNEGDWLPVNDDVLWGGGHAGDGKELHVYTKNSSGALVTGYDVDAYLEDDFGTEKTIFDPCPYGWRVSPGDIWLGFTEDGLNFTPGRTAGAATNAWGQINVEDGETPLDVAKQCGFTMYMEGWHAGRTSFFPTQGSRVPSGQPYNIGGICGNYHNATVDQTIQYDEDHTIRRVDILHFHTQNYENYSAAGEDVVDGEYVILKPFTNELYYYCKAVAGPLRCVRDTK